MTGVHIGTSGLTTGAVFAYDEVAGQPRLTRLSDDTSGFNGALVDIVDTQPSEYFVFNGPVCKFGRIRLDPSGTPILESSLCAFAEFAELEVVALTPQGDTVVADTQQTVNGRRLSVLSNAGVRNIASGALVTPVLDHTTSPPTLVAWVSHDNFEGYACVEESPVRCWSVPGYTRLVDSRVEAGVISLLLHAQDGMKNRFTVVRTIGSGDATPP